MIVDVYKNKIIYKVKINSFTMRSNVIRFNGTYLINNENKMIPFINIILPNTSAINNDSDTEEDEELMPPTPTNTNFITSNQLYKFITSTPTNTNFITPIPTNTNFITITDLNLLLSKINITKTINPTVEVLQDKVLQQQREQDYIRQVLAYLKIGMTVQTYDGYRNKYENFIVTSINNRSNAKNFNGKGQDGKDCKVPLVFVIIK